LVYFFTLVAAFARNASYRIVRVIRRLTPLRLQSVPSPDPAPTDPPALVNPTDPTAPSYVDPLAEGESGDVVREEVRPDASPLPVIDPTVQLDAALAALDDIEVGDGYLRRAEFEGPNNQDDDGNPIAHGIEDELLSVGPQQSTGFATFTTDPRRVPSFWNTIAGLIFHLFVYAALFMSISAYRERELWLAANDGTRAFLVNILRHRSGVNHILFFLPADWQHWIDGLMWKYFVQQMAERNNFRMPG